ncbi:MAG: SIS domain-containing protein [Candidatus Thermoplasmatota archaeon]
MKETLRYLIDSLGSAVDQVDVEMAEALVSRLLDAKRVFVYGVGRSGLVAKMLAVRLVQLGMDVHFVGDSTTPIVTADDLVLVVSSTGGTMSAVQTANIAGRVGACVVGITSNRNSKLAHAADLLITIKIEESAERPIHAPLGTLFEIASLTFLDSLVPLLMSRLGQDESAMKSRHAIWV